MTERKRTTVSMRGHEKTIREGVWMRLEPDDPDFDELIDVATNIKSWLEHGSLDRADPPYERLCKALEPKQ